MSDITIDDLRQNILINLGSGGTLSGGIDVELNNDELDQAIQSALQLLNMYVPMRATANLSVAAGTSVWPMNHPMFRGIVDVQAVNVGRCNFNDPYPDPFNPYGDVVGTPYGGLAANAYGDSYGEVLAERMYGQTVRLVNAAEFNWTTRQDQAGATLLVIQSRGARNVEYTYTWAIEQSDSTTIGVGRMPDPSYAFVQNYSLAVGKQILGRKLRKYGGGINMPDGGTETLDGDALVQEGNAETQALEDAFKKRRRPIPPGRG